MNEPPLLNLFIRLREEAGLPLRIDDYLSFIRALKAGFGISNLKALAQLCRSLWIRSESEERIFNAYFEQMIESMEFTSKDSSFIRKLLQILSSPGDMDLTPDKLEILTSREHNILKMLYRHLRKLPKLLYD